MPQFIAGFEGLSHALPALAVFWLLISASVCARRSPSWP
jgi:hypothetical protein